MEPVVSTSPGATQLFVLFENHGFDPASPQPTCSGETRRTSADDNDIGLWHETEISAGAGSVQDQLHSRDEQHRREQLPEYRRGSALAAIARADPSAEHDGNAPDGNVRWQLRDTGEVSQQSRHRVDQNERRSDTRGGSRLRPTHVEKERAQKYSPADAREPRQESDRQPDEERRPQRRRIRYDL